MRVAVVAWVVPARLLLLIAIPAAPAAAQLRKLLARLLHLRVVGKAGREGSRERKGSSVRAGSLQSP